MRRALDGLYALSAGLAALSLLGIFLVMVGGVAARVLGREIPAARPSSRLWFGSSTAASSR